MLRQAVSSNNLHSIGYETFSQTLEIEFHSGGIYQYAGVPEHIYQSLMSAASKGRYFELNVKKAGFAYRRVG